MDEEGEAPKEKLLVVITTPAEAITADFVVINAPREKYSVGTDDASSLLSSSPLYPETVLVPLLMEEEEDEPK